jgi:hypothetical protein
MNNKIYLLNKGLSDLVILKEAQNTLDMMMFEDWDFL